jgi:hypothetical protein
MKRVKKFVGKEKKTNKREIKFQPGATASRCGHPGRPLARTGSSLPTYTRAQGGARVTDSWLPPARGPSVR